MFSVIFSNSSAVGRDVFGKRGDGGKDAAGLFAFRRERDPVGLLEREAEFECVDAVEPEPFAEERRVGFDFFGANVLERTMRALISSSRVC